MFDKDRYRKSAKSGIVPNPEKLSSLKSNSQLRPGNKKVYDPVAGADIAYYHHEA